MKRKEVWDKIITILVTVLTSVATVFGLDSCVVNQDTKPNQSPTVNSTASSNPNPIKADVSVKYKD